VAKKKILIVDDDRDLLLALGVRLRKSGYAVVSAMDGVSAIATARQEAPDLVLLDLGLPAGDGFVVLERIRSLIPLAATPVIVLSARDAASNKDRALKLGAAKFLQKPPDNEELLDAIWKCLGDEGVQT
jgi:DNA-binding response OmpR family regulator